MENRRWVVVVIPAYEPDEKLVELVRQLRVRSSYKIVVVDDGSGIDYKDIFEQVGKYAKVLSYAKNKGKGYALKTAFKWVKEVYGEAVSIVTADADGQHRLEDIAAVVSVAEVRHNALVLGSRAFNGKVPFKSLLGNKMTSLVFYLASGVKVKDTQTGLRAFDGSNLEECINIPGERYEYEMNMLMDWAKKKRNIYEQLIETIYMNDNKGSHFHPIRDSFRIYKEIFKFSCSSFVSFVADYILYVVLTFVTQGMGVQMSLWVSNIGARLISGMLNYELNRRFVFKSKERSIRTAGEYILLAVSILALNTVLLTFLVETMLPNKFIAKVVVECILFILSLTIQKKIIFRKRNIKKVHC
nr:bifunctional glycosyltransferase family 2/GtrA family protein [uncultured Cellulosilyticum sp.]